MVYEVRPATPADVEYVSSHLRESDKREIWASHRRMPEELPPICNVIECFVGVKDDVPFVMFGVHDMGEKGVPWLLATDSIQMSGLWFLRESKKICHDWMMRFNTLSNYVHADNKDSIAWLKWLNFDIGEELIVNGERFLRFEKGWWNV